MKNGLLPQDLRPGLVALLGVPFDANASFLQGSAQAPGRIRQVLTSGASNLCTEKGVDLAGHPAFRDLGDLQFHGDQVEEVFPAITRAVEALVDQQTLPLVLGGDHSITYPIVRAVAACHQPLAILHLDAHPDLYDSFGGNRLSHACPFARILENGLIRRLVQVGVRTMNAPQQEKACRFGVEVHQMRDWAGVESLRFEELVYVSLDLDVFDPAFAPGVSHHEPGGLSPREVIRLLHRLQGRIVAADIVELNPTRDVVGITAALAVKMLKELAGAMLSS